MDVLDYNLLSLLTFTPVAGAALLLCLPKLDGRAARLVALLTTGVALLFALRAAFAFDTTKAGLQFAASFRWIPTIHADYSVGVDGLSLLLVVLSAILVPVAIVATRPEVENARLYFFFTLVLQSGMFGAFTAQSFFHWFLFWELVLVPAFFLVKMWGGPKANAASLKFFLYTLVGSVCMLLAFQAIYLATESLDFHDLASMGQSGELRTALGALAKTAGLSWAPATCGMLAFLGIAFACAIKTPMWPFHTWLPDAYAEAPTPITMLLTGALSKMGVYALLRIAVPLFPDAARDAAPTLLTLSLITVVAGALSAYAQTDLKRMFAYSSINHVGFCLLGIFAAVGAAPAGMRAAQIAADRSAALNGVVVQMFAHGLGAAALFYLLHSLELRARVRGIDDFGGLRPIVPRFFLAFGIAAFASLGLPGLSGFVGELLILKGVFGLAPWTAALSMIGVVATAVFLLRIIQRAWSGPTPDRLLKLSDLTTTELAGAAVLILLMFAVGIVPGRFVAFGNASVTALVDVLTIAGGGR